MADYLKIPEVARRLDVSEPTVRRMVKSGKLPSVFVGGAYRVSEQDLEDYLQSARVQPGKAPGPAQLEQELSGADEERRLPTAEEMDEVTAFLVRLIKQRLANINRWREIGIDALEEATFGWVDMNMANDQISRELQERGTDEVINQGSARAEDLKAALRQTDVFGSLLGIAADARIVVGELSEQATKEGARTVEAIEDLLMATRDNRDS